MYILLVVILLMILCISRAIAGPSVWDRILASNLISTKIVMLIILYASLQETAYLLDFAIVYALLGFISVIFIAMFTAGKGTLGKGEKKWKH